MVDTAARAWQPSGDVPFADLGRAHSRMGGALHGAFARVLREGSFTLGKEVEAFEAAFAAYAGVSHGVGVGSGTDALHLSLRALGVGPGDEVVTAVNTFAATAEAIRMCGARPVFVDVEPDTLLMDVGRLEESVTPATKAVIPVHLYGQPADMDGVLDVARHHGLRVIEDACQAHGATYGGRPAGSLGDAGCFSFYPSKNLGALGDGGFVTTDGDSLQRRVRLLRNHGEDADRLHLESAYCSRLHGLQAALLAEKLSRLDEWNALRVRAARLYDEGFAGTSVITPAIRADRTHVFHLYVVRVEARDEVRAELAARGIQTGIHYPLPLHLEPAFADCGYGRGDFPVAEEAAGRILSLPMFPHIEDREVEAVVDAVLEAAGG